MNNEIWQQLLSLENRDITAQWFNQLHNRELNARRTKEINSAAKQAREYFRNASNSNYSVRPLLTFYGVACLSRSLLLLLRPQGGEEGLTGSHGLETVDWGSVMSGDTTQGLKRLCDLKIRTRAGLFTDFINQTKNKICIHVNSSNVDWRLCYNIPPLGEILSLGDLFSRTPDLESDYKNVSEKIKYAAINNMTYSMEDGLMAKIAEKPFSNFKDIYDSYGYVSTSDSGWSNLTAPKTTFETHTALFTHKYIKKTFGSIPALHLSAPFSNGSLYSQTCIIYMISYILGMLVRYYPTHWMSLIQGEKGDTWWPTINRAQQIVEQSYPELVMELITDTLNHPLEM